MPKTEKERLKKDSKKLGLTLSAYVRLLVKIAGSVAVTIELQE